MTRLQGKYLTAPGVGFIKVIAQKGDYLFGENPGRGTCTIVRKPSLQFTQIFDAEVIEHYMNVEPGTVLTFEDGTEEVLGPVKNFKLGYYFTGAEGKTRYVYEVAGVEKDEWE